MTSSKMSSYSQHGSTWNVAELPPMPRARMELTGLQFQSSVYLQSMTISVLVISQRILSLSVNQPCSSWTSTQKDWPAYLKLASPHPHTKYYQQQLRPHGSNQACCLHFCPLHSSCQLHHQVH